MKIDEGDLLMVALISGLIICSPFIAAYYGGKWVYNQSPWQRRKGRKTDAEIHELEIRLEITGRNKTALNYDPYYCKKNNNREEYLADLRKKVAENYQSPDLILVTREFESHGVCAPQLCSDDCLVLVLAHIDYYQKPSATQHTFGFTIEPRADEYFNSFYQLINCMIDTVGKLTTLSECGKYENYFVVKIPGKFKYDEVNLTNERIKTFIGEFKRKYGKPHLRYSD